jgi:HEAT repeat protein
VEGLRHQTGREAVMLLIERLGDRDSQVQQAAVSALESRPPGPLLEILQAIPPGKGKRILGGARPLLSQWEPIPEYQDFLRSCLQQEAPGGE